MLDIQFKEIADELKTHLDSTQRELKAAQGELKEKMVAFEEKAARKEDLSAIEEKMKESGKQLETLGSDLEALMKKNARLTRVGKDAAQIMCETKDFAENLKASNDFNLLEFKDITTSVSPNVTLSAMTGHQDQGFVNPLTQRLFLRDLLPTASASFSTWHYVQEALFTNNADIVAEGAQKPQSDITFEAKQGVMKKIAHYFRVSEEALDDISGLEGYIRMRGVYGLRFKEEEQLLSGDGSTDQLDGLLNNSTAYDPSLVDEPAINVMDDILKSIAQVEEADFYADVAVMNHLDVAALRVKKDADGKYLHPAFTGNSAWGLPIVSTKGIEKGKFLVAGLRGNAMLWDRKSLEIRRSTEDRDNFVKNMVTILIESRLGLEVIRPQGVIYGDISAPVAE